MILGKFIKQPLEIESYSIQYAQDMAETDEGVACWVLIYDRDATENPIVLTAPFTVSQSNASYYTSFDVTLPANPVEGFAVAIGNTNQVLPITINSDGINGDPTFVLPTRQAVYLKRVSGKWVIEVQVSAILVTAPLDHRVRSNVTGGLNFSNYKVEVTLQTQEGRVLQNEFILKVKDS
jgi:hypothetical protein